MKMTDANPRKGMRAFSYSVKQVDLDPQGRLVIPQELVNYAHINKDVKICGAVSRIEIWAKEVSPSSSRKRTKTSTKTSVSLISDYERVCSYSRNARRVYARS